MINGCIFCKTDSIEFNSNRLIFKNDTVAIFHSNQPTKPGHVLVIPRDHYATIWETPDELLQKLILYVKRISSIVKEVTSADGINVGLNNGEAAGQKVKHLHFHVIPRHFDDGLKLMPSGEIEEYQLLQMTDKIRRKLEELK